MANITKAQLATENAKLRAANAAFATQVAALKAALKAASQPNTTFNASGSRKIKTLPARKLTATELAYNAKREAARQLAMTTGKAVVLA